MIPFNFKLFFKLAYLSLFKTKGTHGRLTGKRVVFLVIATLTYIPLQLIHGFFLLLDWVFFPAFNKIEVKQPVFIIGNPRTGSTHLMRVLAKDEKNFAVAKLWELVLAPSITQRKLVRALGKLDQRLGSPLKNWILEWEARAFREGRKYRRVRFELPDEDELSLLTIFSAIHLVFAFPFLEAFRPIVFFDQKVSPTDQRHFMAYYKRCMQRTLYIYGTEKHILSKSPANSGRVGTLGESFPDGRFIYLTRTPLEVFPSLMSLFSFNASLFADLLEPYPFGDKLLEMTKHWYSYPLDTLEQNANGYLVLRYEDLVQDLDGSVHEIYTSLGLEIHPAYTQSLQTAVAKAEDYNSRHDYSLAAMGYTPEQIIAEYRDAFERFGFETAVKKTIR